MFSLSFILLSVNAFSGDFINVPDFPDKNFFEIQKRDYISSGIDQDLNIYKYGYVFSENSKNRWSVTYNKFNSSESSLKYVSSAIEYKCFVNNGNDRYMFYFIDNTENGFYDSFIFSYGRVGFGFNFNGSSDIDSIARFGAYDIAHLKREIGLGKTGLQSSDFVSKFFLIFNYSMKLNDMFNINLDYNGDAFSTSINFEKNGFSLEYAKINSGDYYELSEYAGIIQDDKVIRIVYEIK